MKHSRRAFLEAGLALPAAVGVMPSLLEPSPATESVAHDSTYDPWVEIQRENLRHNVQEISRRVSGRPILAVIKNNGYGTGVVNIAQLLEPQSEIHGFAVVKLHEAHSLRDAGVKKPILLLGPFDEQNLSDAVVRNITPMVYTPLGPALDKISARLQKPVPLVICIDTGIGRVGVPYRDAASLVRDLAGRKSVDILSTMMTFAEDPDFDHEQLRRFTESCASLEKEGIALGKKHAASSFTLFQHPDAFLDMVRPGMAIYGIYSENEFRRTNILDLRPAISLKSRVIYVKKLRKGESAGYNRAYVAKDDVWVATLPVGHADGWPRTAAPSTGRPLPGQKGAKVRISSSDSATAGATTVDGSNLYPVIASVSASHCIVEIGVDRSAVAGENSKKVKIGDVATFFDAQPGSRPEDVAEACGASVYDLTMHLNPLLPRRMV